MSLAAGGSAALIVVLSFGIFHSLWIVNVRAVFVEGIFYAFPAAFALAWAIRMTRKSGRFRGGLRDGLMLGFLFWLTLVPYEVVGASWGPWPDPEAFDEVVGLLWLAFLGVPLGAAIGWTLTRSRQAATAWAVATFSMDISLGGGIAFNGGRGAMLGLFLWLLPTHLLGGVALVSVHALFFRGTPATEHRVLDGSGDDPTLPEIP